MKYQNGTIAIFSEGTPIPDDITRLVDAFVDINSLVLIKTSATRVIFIYTYDYDHILDASTENEEPQVFSYYFIKPKTVNNMFKQAERTIFPEDCGLRKLPIKLGKKTNLKGNSLLWVDAEYLQKLTGVTDYQIYDGTVPVISIDSDTIMILGNTQGYTVSLPVSVHKLRKHAVYYNDLTTDMFI